MRTSIKFAALSQIAGKHQQLSALAGAISWEMQKYAMCIDLAGARLAGLNPNVKGIKPPSVDLARMQAHVKAWLGAKYSTPSDTPNLADVANEMEEFYHTNMPEMDGGWMALFDLVDLRGSTHDHFDILDTNAGLSYTQRLPGERIDIRRNITEAKATVSYLTYADGIGILDEWIQFNQFWNIDEVVAEFIAQHFEKMASLHYGLFTALGSGVNQTFATDDVTTANNAAATILRAVRTKGYAVGGAPTFYALCAPEKVGRLEKMLTAQRGSAIVDYGTVSQPLTHRIGGIIGTTHVAAADTGWYLILPGHKMKRGVWKDLDIESGRNIYHRATDITAEAMYNAAIGDSDQVRRCLYS